MIKVQYLGQSPEDVEGFPTGEGRTIEGALHLKPRKLYKMTEAEYAHIQKVRPDLKFVVYGKPFTTKEEKVEVKKDVAPQPETEPDEDFDGGK